jgi:hypothetical protein
MVDTLTKDRILSVVSFHNAFDILPQPHPTSYSVSLTFPPISFLRGREVAGWGDEHLQSRR